MSGEVREAEDLVVTGSAGQSRVAVVYSGQPGSADPRGEMPVLGFRDYWYPVIGVEKLRRHPVRVQLLGEQLCVFKGKSGPTVLSDICPHRGASLSGGRCNYAGTVSCPYHGWTFDERGECVAVLSEGPMSAIPGRVRVRRFPTRLIKDVVFAWMGEGEPTAPESDLPPELFDDSVVFHDATVWKANWRPALENMNDNHVRYTHRNSVQLLLRPFGKMSFDGARPIFSGGGVTLTHYTDPSLQERPYREHFAGVAGLWPKHRYRLLWSWIFTPRVTRWIWALGEGTYSTPNRLPTPYHQGSRGHVWEWNQGPHMPGMLRINGSSSLYTRWCVPIDEGSTREFYFFAVRPRTATGRLWEAAKYPLVQKLLRNRNLGFQDGVVLAQTRFDAPERFSAFDVETMAWRRLAILSARHGGRHDKIPPEVIERLNRPAFELLAEGAGAEDGTVPAQADLQLR